jgi:HEAT repeat protein
MSGFDAKLLVTHEAIQALGSRDDAEALVTLAAVAAVDDQFLRRTAVEVIGRHPHGRELSAIILNALRDPSEYVVRTACDVAEEWSLKEAHDLVLPLLANDSGATRRSALRALGSIWAETDFPTVFKIFTGDSEIDVRRDAGWVLRRQATSATWQTIFDAFCTDELARHRQWACELAESFSGPELLPALSPLLSDPDGHVRKAAARAVHAVSRQNTGTANPA